jgi:hypothetical protein
VTKVIAKPRRLVYTFLISNHFRPLEVS